MNNILIDFHLDNIDARIKPIEHCRIVCQITEKWPNMNYVFYQTQCIEMGLGYVTESIFNEGMTQKF